MRGNFNTQMARTPVINISKCNPTQRDTCKSDEEIKEYLKDKLLVIIENNYKFKPEVIDKNKRVEKRSEISFIPLDPTVAQENFKTLHVFNMTF